jgi:hypothetical protein
MISGLPNYRFTADEFIKYAGWVTPYNRNYVKIALEFFQNVVPADVWRRRADNPGPWLLPRGNAIKLCEWMQSIDFNNCVYEDHLRPGQILKKFSIRGQSRFGWGNFFTLCDQKQNKMGLYSAQNTPNYFEVTTFTRCLCSTVSDAYADWTDGMTSEYSHGGGVQIFIWKPEFVLKKVAL